MNLNLDTVPKTLDEAVDLIVNGLEDEDISYIRNHPKPSYNHFGIGMWFRNNWSLWERDTPLTQWFIKNLGIVHADDTSSTIFAAVWAKVRNELFNPLDHVEKYKRYWWSIDQDPLFGGK